LGDGHRPFGAEGLVRPQRFQDADDGQGDLRRLAGRLGMAFDIAYGVEKNGVGLGIGDGPAAAP